MDEITVGLESIAAAVRDLLERTQALEPGADEGAAGEVRAGIIEVGRASQALHGLLLELVGEGDRLGVARGGIGP